MARYFIKSDSEDMLLKYGPGVLLDIGFFKTKIQYSLHGPPFKDEVFRIDFLGASFTENGEIYLTPSNIRQFPDFLRGTYLKFRNGYFGPVNEVDKIKVW